MKEYNIIPDAREKVIVNYFLNGKLISELWTVENLWLYFKEAFYTGNDPFDLMHITQNEFALGRAEVYGLYSERRKKLGRI